MTCGEDQGFLIERVVWRI